MVFALTTEELTAFRRQRRADDAIAVEAGQTMSYFYDHTQDGVKRP
jgi:hypothetical protein